MPLDQEEQTADDIDPACCSRRGGLVVGNYCHDRLFRDGRLVGDGLGGAASFVHNVFHAISPPLPLRYVAKVGPDFRHPLPFSPSSSSFPTTLFHAFFSSSSCSSLRRPDRILRRVAACDPILPADLTDGAPFDFGLAVAVAGEISAETLARMIDVCRIVFVDAQALLRTFDAQDGTVSLVPIRDTAFYPLLRRIGFLKASADEAPFLAVHEIRKSCCVLVTNGKDGCTIYWRDEELHVPAFPARQVDPTGAGDSFFGGFVAGLVMFGLSVPDAALLGNFFGSLAVRHVGIPNFHPPLMQAIKEEFGRKTAGKDLGICSKSLEDIINFEKSKEHEEFMRFLAAEADKIVQRDGYNIPNGEAYK